MFDAIPTVRAPAQQNGLARAQITSLPEKYVRLLHNIIAIGSKHPSKITFNFANEITALGNKALRSNKR